ncbi:MAG: flagellar biosynthesis protein FliR [Sulfuricurvum sp. PC08-66]|nr:MAG: flagellar biosynthesis protein FliR [Sulfuricurvum sp. PC08-66]
MDFVSLLTQEYTLNFLLLFVRFSALMVFLPIFNHMALPAQYKAIIAFYLTIMFYANVPSIPVPSSYMSVVMMVLAEIAMGLLVGLVLQIVLAMVSYAGEQISFIMGFTMASVIDPQTQMSTPLMSSFLSLIALMILLAINAHHWMIEFMYLSVSQMQLGAFVPHASILNYLVAQMGLLFVVGLTIAFPILALSLLVDIIFGMLMKTMPQFNLLVIGFPIKIMVAFVVLMAVLASMMLIFSQEFQKAFNALGKIIYS